MPSKVKPLSLRPPADVRMMITLFAEGQGITPHAAAIQLISLGAGIATSPANPGPADVSQAEAIIARRPTAPLKPSPAALQILADAEKKAAHLGKPRRKLVDLKKAGVQLGPSTPPFGSRLKQPGGKNAR